MATKLFTVYRLHFTGPLHIGDVRDDYGVSLRTISSDTMYAALTATLAKIGVELPQDGDLGCVISSLFPYYQSNESSAVDYYFPKPLCTQFVDLEPAQLKVAKKMQWVNQSAFEQVLAGQKINACANPDFIRSEVSERVMVSRDYSEDSRPYYMDRLYLQDEAGMYFLAEGDSSLIDKAMPLLALEGLGTDRNVGNGFFEYTRAQLMLEVPDVLSHGITLSTFIPESKVQLEACMANGCSYELQRRGGWITTQPYNSLRKNAIYAFAAGSMFSSIQSGNGRIVDLAPKGLVKHPVWRCGKALVLPVKVM